MSKWKGSCNFDFKDKEKNIKLYMRMMFNRTQQMFEYDGLPETIPQRNLERLLQETGFAVFTKVNDELYAFTGGLDGQAENVYYDMSWATIANAPLNFSGTVYFKGNLKHDPNAVLMRNDSKMMSLWDLNAKYASLLAETDLTLYLIDIMSRATAILTANDDKSMLSAKQYLLDIQKGNLGVIAGNLMYESVKTQPYIESASETVKPLLELEQYTKASWLNDLGINANFNMKREALNSSESALNEDALKPLIDDMLYCRQIACDEINSLFGTNISVKLASVWETNDYIQELELQALENEGDPEIVETSTNSEGVDVETTKEDIEENPENIDGEEDQEAETEETAEDTETVEINVDIDVNTEDTKQEEEVKEDDELDATGDEN